MEAPLHEHRFQQLQAIHDGRVGRLELVRDIVEDRRCWLLRAKRPVGRVADAALWFRVQSGWGAWAHPERGEILDHLVDEGHSLLVLEPLAGELLTQAVTRLDAKAASEVLEQLADCLDGARSRAWPAGALDLGSLWWDGRGVRVLPSAWLLPTGPENGDGFWIDHEDEFALAAEIRALWNEVETFCRDGAADETLAWGDELVQLVTKLGKRVLGEDVEPEIPKPVQLAIHRADEEVRCAVVHTSRPEFAASRLTRWFRNDGRSVVELRPHSRVEDDHRARERADVLILQNASHYADFAVSLDRLAKRGWIDGSELTVLVTREPIEDEALQMMVSSRSQGDGPVLVGWDFESPETEALQAGPDASGRVLEALAVTKRDLPGDWLLSAFSWTPQALAEALHVLLERRQIVLSYGYHHAGVGLHLLIAPAVGLRTELDGARAAEVQGLLAAVAAQHPNRGRSLGPQWLYAELLAAVDPTAAARRLRSLALSADRSGLGLFAAGVYGRLLSLGDESGITREDQCRAAIARSGQYRRHGKLDLAHNILADALQSLSEEEVEGRSNLPATLLTDTVLSLVQLEIHRSNFNSAESRLSNLLAGTKGDLPAKQRARVYLELSWVQLQLGRTSESCHTSELVIRILDTHAYPDLVARAHNQLGFALYKESDYSSSVVHYLRALRLREQVGDDLAVARTQNNLGLSYRALGQLGDAERSLRESLRLKRIAGEELSAAASLLNLGFVLLDRGSIDAAEESGNRCLEIARLHSHPETEAEAYGLLGEIALASGRLDEARQLLTRDLAICESTGHEAEGLATLRRLSEVLLRLGEEDVAAKRLEEARTLLSSQPSRYEASLLDRLEGELLRRSGAVEPAVDAFSAAARGFAEVHRYRSQLECLALRGVLELDAGREDAARATLAEVRDLLARHEIHRLPTEVEALEQRMSNVATGVKAAGPRTCLKALNDMLLARTESERPIEDILQALRSALSVLEVVWIFPGAQVWRLSSESLREGTMPQDLASLSPSTGESSPRRVGDWWVASVPGSDGAWLGVQTQRTLDASEEQLLFGAACILAERREPKAKFELGQRGGVEVGKPEGEIARGLVGRSMALQNVERMIERVADTEVSVLLLGENGTGKELVARALHDRASSRVGEFVAVNCASIPANLLESELFGHERGSFTSAYDQRIGRFEQAAGGTLLLDEIGEMPLEMQSKLLRVLQERSFTRVGGSESIHTDARILAATNRDLLAEVRRGRFRTDLYYRINVVTIDIPPLRARREDIEVLARHFLSKHAPRFGGKVREISREALQRLEEYDWPGNVRELENVVTNALVFASSQTLRLEDLPTSVASGVGAEGKARLEDIVRQLIDTEDWSEERPLLPRLETWVVKEMVDRIGNKTKAARMLGITKPTVYDRLRRFDALYGENDEDGSEPGGES